MQNPSRLKIFLYQYLTFGIYFFVWCHRLGKELSTSLKKQAVPSMWWFIIPGGAYYWIWRMSESLDTATGHRIKKTDVFLLYLVFSGGGFLFGSPYSFNFGSGSNSSISSDTSVNLRLILIIAAIVLAALIFIGITLHAVYISIIQGKIDKVRGGDSNKSVPKSGKAKKNNQE
ncbi:hypothetical protein KC946_03045 [Candidatus Saccharibacteria bacterium]|nr:hypothetical protein [Candidatus Saccharibacteria bacterium]